MVYEYAYNTYPYPLAGTPYITLSNIGVFGYTQSMAPLRKTEAMRFTIMEVERKPVWQKETDSFEPKDMLPVSISADHRIFDGNSTVPKMVEEQFQTMFAKMCKEKPKSKPALHQHEHLELIVEQLLATNVEMGYKTLMLLQTCWFDFISIEECYAASSYHGVANHDTREPTLI
nr:2-oxo acid dehydrogenase subunit E2 [Legionella anisa]